MSDFWAPNANFDQKWRNVAQSWPESVQHRPSLANVGSIRSNFGRSLDDVGRLWRALRPEITPKMPSRALFEHSFTRCPAHRPTGSNLASKVRARCAEREHFAAVFNMSQGMGSPGETTPSQSCTRSKTLVQQSSLLVNQLFKASVTGHLAGDPYLAAQPKTDCSDLRCTFQCSAVPGACLVGRIATGRHPAGIVMTEPSYSSQLFHNGCD